MKTIAWLAAVLVVTVGCSSTQNSSPASPGPDNVDPLPASSGAETDRNAAWSDLQALLKENGDALPRLDVKELLFNGGGTAYTQRFSAELGAKGKWPSGGALYIYGWKGEGVIYAIVARTEGDTLDLNDRSKSLLEKREFENSQ